MAPSVWGPVFLQQPAAVFDDLAPEFSESEVEDVHEDEMEEEEEGEGDEHGSDGEVVPMDTEDSGEEHEHYYGCGRDMLTLCFPGAVHIFMSASPDKVSQVEAALSLKGRLDPADYTAVPPAERNTLTMTFRDQECEFDSVTPDEVQDILLSFAGRDLMVPRIELKMVFPNGSYDFDSVSPDKLQAVLSLLEGMELTVSAALPCAFKQLTEPLMCWIDVLDPVCPCKVQALHSLLGGNELNPGIGRIYPASEVEFPALVALLMRFREKLENQDFVKICYTAVWKKLALRMQRSRCQFTSSRRKPDKSASELVTPDGSANTGSVESANRGLVEARCLSAAE